jgi:hypothetical protein
MGKRSNFERVARDCYDTPYDAVIPLLYHLPDNTEFIEPCAGKNALVQHLQLNGHRCILASDVNPRDSGIQNCCVFEQSFPSSGIIITNPPWNRKILHPLIEKIISEEKSAWLLFDADWCHTKQAIPYMPYVSDIVSVGRIKWIDGSKYTGKDNCAWYRIEPTKCVTLFHGRVFSNQKCEPKND